MNAVVLSRQFTRRPVSSRERGFAIANDRIQGLERVFGPIPEEQCGNRSAHYLTGNELARNQIRLASFIGAILRI
jgi:hypothetical protein